MITLEIAGKMLTSEEMAEKIEKLGVQGTSHIIFIIGGSIGLGREILKKIGLCTELFKDDISTSINARHSAGTDLPQLSDHEPRTISQIRSHI